jgi:hypothetical protein
LKLSDWFGEDELTAMKEIDEKISGGIMEC